MDYPIRFGGHKSKMYQVNCGVRGIAAIRIVFIPIETLYII